VSWGRLGVCRAGGERHVLDVGLRSGAAINFCVRVAYFASASGLSGGCKKKASRPGPRRIAEFGGSDEALIRRQSRCKLKANAGFQPLLHARLVGEASAFRQGQTLSLDGERRAAKRPGRQREMERLSGFFDEL
jgi:hypothetical protein